MGREFTVEAMGIKVDVHVHTDDAGNNVEVYVKDRGTQWPLKLRTQGEDWYSVTLLISDTLKLLTGHSEDSRSLRSVRYEGDMYESAKKAVRNLIRLYADVMG